LFVNIINHKNKNVKSTLSHPKVKYGSDHNGFNKGKEHMPFHGLIDHDKDYLIRKMFVWKYNQNALPKD
jgi:hypothetical protein